MPHLIAPGETVDAVMDDVKTVRITLLNKTALRIEPRRVRHRWPDQHEWIYDVRGHGPRAIDVAAQTKGGKYDDD